MRFGIPSRPVPVTEHARLRAEADEAPDVALEKARRRLEDLEARARVVADFQSADRVIPRRRAED